VAFVAFMGSRFLIYAVEVGFWPYAMIRFRQLSRAADWRGSGVATFVGAFLIAAIFDSYVLAYALR
jgi:hypothetical protein